MESVVEVFVPSAIGQSDSSQGLFIGDADVIRQWVTLLTGYENARVRLLSRGVRKVTNETVAELRLAQDELKRAKLHLESLTRPN
jgi:hypothetical protein